MQIRNNMSTVTRKKLYELIDCMVSSFGEEYPLNSIKIAQNFCFNPDIMQVDFDSKAMCAALMKMHDKTIIVLNQKRNPRMQNFDCMHELVHYHFHPGNLFNCIDGKSNDIIQDPFLEWQANEGAAQALVPYQTFIPAFVAYSQKYASARECVDNYRDSALADIYHVTPAVIATRAKSLSYEITQYLNGKPVDQIIVLSANEIKKRNLKHDCEYAMEYCTNCCSVVNRHDKFCPICGNETACEYACNTWRGAGYKVYSTLPLKHDGRSASCPACGNNTIHPEAKYCDQCKQDLLNTCSDDPDMHFFADRCALPAYPSDRYCRKCGRKTTFFAAGFLPDWKTP